MSRTVRVMTVAAIVLAVSALGAVLRAEDSGVFRNSGDISRAQAILESEGYLASGSYTPGQMDQSTRQAVSEYQSHHSLNNGGKLDDDTYEMLLSHEVSYPWAEGAAAPAEPAELAPAQPVAPVTQSAPPAEVRVAEAPPVPEPTPATAEVKEAPAAAAAAPAAEEPARKMPSTASYLPLLALSGLGALGLGILVLLRRSA